MKDMQFIQHISTAIMNKPYLAEDIQRALTGIHKTEQELFWETIQQYSTCMNIAPETTKEGGQGFSLLTAKDLLTTEWPEPVWAVPQLLPVGLSILAGAPKVGKSWMALQLALAISSGGMFLGKQLEQGRTLYLALEDPPQRLAARMKAQGWKAKLDAEFMPLGQFEYQIGDITNGGGERLARQIQDRKYRLVVLDTFSRSVPGDQSDVHDMTASLTPIQEMAHKTGAVVLMVDHHRKSNGFNADAIADILGSTAKGAMTDTVWGLYRERGKQGANLAITGREVEEQTLSVNFDRGTFCWEYEGDANSLKMTERRQEIIDALEVLGKASLTEISNNIGQDKSNTYRRLQDMVNAGIIGTYETSGDIKYHLLG
ncbi:MAG: AAA family ATPase [Anaerolineales bacterium]|nr:AAA family ATPase [Anaerolineales bacterium]